MNRIIKNTLILTLITTISGIALGTVYEVTKEPIRITEMNAKKEACKVAFPDADEFEQMDVDVAVAEDVINKMQVKATVDEIYTAMEGGEPVGYVITATDKEGYGGDIQISVGVYNDGKTNGVSILSISETAGLGMKAKEPAFYEQYMNKETDSFYVAKDGGAGEPIDALSGATITSRAVTGAVNTALGYYQNALGVNVNE